MSNIREVAKRAGVSTATVSRVLSRPDVVSPDTRTRVLKAVERLGYSPNSVAKNLRTLKSCKLLVTVPDISNPFFALILQGIEEAAQKNGYAVLVGDTELALGRSGPELGELAHDGEVADVVVEGGDQTGLVDDENVLRAEGILAGGPARFPRRQRARRDPAR